jgi:hypothetical protein
MAWHTVEVTTGKVSDDSMADTLLHGEEATAPGDRGYADRTREPDRARDEDARRPALVRAIRAHEGCDTTPEEKRLNRLLMAALRSAVEHARTAP